MLGLVKYLVNLKRIKMKKLFFSAIVLVAFSSVAMANTIDIDVVIKDYQIEGAQQEKGIEDIRAVNCATYAMDALEFLDSDNHMTPVQAHNVYQSLYSHCYNYINNGSAG